MIDKSEKSKYYPKTKKLLSIVNEEFQTEIIDTFKEKKFGTFLWNSTGIPLAIGLLGLTATFETFDIIPVILENGAKKIDIIFQTPKDK